MNMSRWLEFYCSFVIEQITYISSRAYLDSVRRRPGPFTDKDFDTSDEAVSRIERMKLL